MWVKSLFIFLDSAEISCPVQWLIITVSDNEQKLPDSSMRVFVYVSVGVYPAKDTWAKWSLVQMKHCYYLIQIYGVINKAETNKLW